MFGLYNRRIYNVEFTEENKEMFNDLLTEIYKILRDSTYTAQANWIKEILFTVQKEDPNLFKQKVISAELLGGAGSVVDVWIEEEEEMKKLDSLLTDFLELTFKSGLKHRALKARMTRKIITNPNNV